MFQSMYTNAILVVQLGSEVLFISHIGRVCIRVSTSVSPLLFNMFIADLEQHLGADEAGGIGLIHSKVCLLFCADDLVLSL